MLQGGQIGVEYGEYKLSIGVSISVRQYKIPKKRLVGFHTLLRG